MPLKNDHGRIFLILKIFNDVSLWSTAFALFFGFSHIFEFTGLSRIFISFALPRPLLQIQVEIIVLIPLKSRLQNEKQSSKFP